MAVRGGDMKLVRVNADRGLFDVRRDAGEAADLAAARPEIARDLEAAWRDWNAGNLAVATAPGAKPPAPPAARDLGGRFRFLPLGEVEPRGWLLDQIRTDATTGYGPVLDKLTDRIDPAVFDSRARTELAKPKIGGDWWNGETTGNWFDGLVRAAYLSGDPAARTRADALAAQFLKMQEEDGYLGIYPKARRFESPVVSQNGELWTQACLFRGLLAYAELSGRADVTGAVARAAKLMISKYGPGRPYWGKKVPRGGPTHNIMFADVCEWLWRATGDRDCADFPRFLYDTYSECPDAFETGIQMRNLSDPALPFTGHGAHVMEHLRVPLFVAHAFGDPKVLAAAENIFPKTDRHLAAGGACIGDEDVLGRPGGPDIGCEYCTMLELLHSLQSGIQKTGRAGLGDRIEVLAFNAAQGARLRDGRAIQYLTRDNQHEASIAAGKGARFKLSPTHEDVAVCCPVTALKFFPYLVAGLWMKEADGSGLVAVAYAPSAVRTQLGGAAVTVETDTLYPFDDEVRMTVRAEAPARFSLRLRAPVWPGAMTVDAPGAEVRAEDGWRVVTKEWRTGDSVTLRFAPEIARKTPATGGGAYWQRGPLVYVLPIAPQRTKTKEYPVAGFADWDVTPAPGAFWDYAVNKSCGRFDFERAAPPGSADPWAASPIALVGTLVNRKSGMPEAVRLVPMGASLLRHTVFEDADHPAAARPRMDLLKGAANLARKAEVDVSSSARGYRGAALIDGVADGFPENPGAEWASQRGGAGTAAKLRWEMPEQVGSVWLFDRPNPADHVAAARIAFSDGSTAEVGPLPNDGATPLRLKFPTKTITWLEVVITRVGPQSRNAGLAEIAVFDKEPLP